MFVPVFPGEPEEPAVTPQTILDMGYSRQALTEAMKKAEERGIFLLFHLKCMRHHSGQKIDFFCMGAC